MMDIITKIWENAEDLIGYASELESQGRKDSEETLRCIIGEIENLCHFMEENPKR